MVHVRTAWYLENPALYNYSLRFPDFRRCLREGGGCVMQAERE